MDELHLSVDSCPDWSLGVFRFFAEAWLGSAPSFNPADCLDVAVDTDFTYGYGLPPVTTLAPYCPNFDIDWIGSRRSGQNWGMQCRKAAMWSHPDLFGRNFILPRPDGKEWGGCLSLDIVRRKTRAWYGQDPHLVVSLRKLYQTKIVEHGI
jgi:hypothetical protein